MDQADGLSVCQFVVGEAIKMDWNDFSSLPIPECRCKHSFSAHFAAGKMMPCVYCDCYFYAQNGKTISPTLIEQIKLPEQTWSVTQKLQELLKIVDIQPPTKPHRRRSKFTEWLNSLPIVDPEQVEVWPPRRSG